MFHVDVGKLTDESVALMSWPEVTLFPSVAAKVPSWVDMLVAKRAVSIYPHRG
jgi:hypothetical protein